MAQANASNQGPRRLPSYGCAELASRLNVGTEQAAYTAYAIIDHCRRLGYWTPFSLSAIKRESARGKFPSAAIDFADLRDAGYLERADRRQKSQRELEILFSVTPAFKSALSGGNHRPGPVKAPPVGQPACAGKPARVAGGQLSFL